MEALAKKNSQKASLLPIRHHAGRLIERLIQESKRKAEKETDNEREIPALNNLALEPRENFAVFE